MKKRIILVIMSVITIFALSGCTMNGNTYYIGKVTHIRQLYCNPFFFMGTYPEVTISYNDTSVTRAVPPNPVEEQNKEEYYALQSFQKGDFVILKEYYINGNLQIEATQYLYNLMFALAILIILLFMLIIIIYKLIKNIPPKKYKTYRNWY